MGPTARPRLRVLAQRLGILDEYIDITGKELRRTSDETRALLLAAMGFDVSDEAAAAGALEAIDLREKERMLEPVHVVREGSRRSSVAVLRNCTGSGRPFEWRVELEEESGEVHRSEGRLAPRPGRSEIRIPLPHRPLPGYHNLRVRVRTHEGEKETEQSFIVAPQTCFTPEEVLDGRRTFGLWTNLYTLRSRRNWGAGDLTDLARLIEWAGGIGAAFVGLNPLHALRNRGGDISPYRPVSRFFRNPLYLDVKAVPELRDCPEARERIDSPEFRQEIENFRGAKHVAYEGVMSVKRLLLKALHRTFAERHRGRNAERGRNYARYLEKEGKQLTDFATFQALEEHLQREGRTENGWPSWPPPYRNPRSAEVEAFRLRHAEEVDFHRYLQFELDRQLSWASEKARAAGMPIGLYQDLALGADPDRSDAWAFQELVVNGVNLGAPPDNYSETGQDWGLPPIDPRRLAEDRYWYWIRLLRAAFAHLGALRIDHIIGLFRLFWVPQGRKPTEGAYVRSPTQDLLGILALESRRHRAIVIGEDLGTVPPGVPAALARWGILSCRLLYFERRRGGNFKPSSRISGRALVTVNNHDLPPFAGYWKGDDLRLRQEVAHIESDEAFRRAETHRGVWRKALLRRLRFEGLLPAKINPADLQGLSAAVHAYLCRTRTPLVGLSLDDLAGETEPVNLPGVGQERHPNWSRRMRLALEDLPDDPSVKKILKAASERTERPPARPVTNRSA
ncbi:MAG: 4-alpha-glucanotransferase [Nitrospinota bacterium]